MDRFSYNFVIEKSGILSENLETLTSSNNPRVSWFFVGILHTFPTYLYLQKGAWDFSYFV